MSFKPFIRIKLSPDEPVTTKHINTVQDNVAHAISQMLGKDTLDRTLLTNVLLLPRVINYVPHTLGRKIQGYVVVNRDAEMTVWTATGSNVPPHLQLPLMTSATGVVSLEVF